MGKPGKDFREAVLVRPDDATALAEAIRDLLRDLPRRQALAAAGRERARIYRWDRLAARWATIYIRETP